MRNLVIRKYSFPNVVNFDRIAISYIAITSWDLGVIRGGKVERNNIIRWLNSPLRGLIYIVIMRSIMVGLGPIKTSLEKWKTLGKYCTVQNSRWWMGGTPCTHRAYDTLANTAKFLSCKFQTHQLLLVPPPRRSK